MSRSRLPTAARIAVIVVLALAAVVGGYSATSAIRKHLDAAPASTPPPTPPAVRGAARPPATESAAPSAPAPAPTAVRSALGPLVTSGDLGRRLRAEVVDVASGAVLYDLGAAAPAPPASTAKILTAAAALAARPATYRIRTRVVRGTGGAVVLVGGGDPTLSAAPAGRPVAYPEAARMSDLAAQLRRAGVRPSRIVVDDSLFTGPTVSPAWAPEDVPSDYASAVTAVLADGGRAAPADAERSSAPDLAAGAELAHALGRDGLPVERGTAPAGAAVLATVSSAPLATLVEQMLQQSDNVIAECLARQVALAEHRPVSFTGSANAVRAVLARLGVDPGAGLVDGSGLAARDRVSAGALAAVVRLLAGPAQARLHAVLAGMPVAAWSGTLADRYVSGSQRAGAGVVRAKTGTLTGVSTLAGTVHDRSGRLLAFALMADRTGDTATAEAALDRIAARLAGL